MDMSQARTVCQEGRIAELVIEPADTGNGWMILICERQGDCNKLTDHSGHEKVYHDLDQATAAAKAIGSVSLRIVEPF